MFWIFLAIIIATGLVVLTAYICCYMACFVPKNQPKEQKEYDLPPGKEYEPYHDLLKQWMDEVRLLPFEAVSIRSFDGLTLHGKYYEYEKGAPIELMMHGYRGSADRDLCGGIQRSFALGHSVLIIDQRACGKSEGNVITFGIHESRDCLKWVDFLIEKFGQDVKIILTGISMGASTVLITAGKPLPPQVVGVLADCGYTSAKEIIQKVMRDMKLPGPLLYPFVRLGAKLFGKVDLDETSAFDAMSRCKLPTIFFHGEADNFVPYEMSKQNFDACAAPKKLVTMADAGHGACYLKEGKRYVKELTEFFEKNNVK